MPFLLLEINFIRLILLELIHQSFLNPNLLFMYCFILLLLLLRKIHHFLLLLINFFQLIKFYINIFHILLIFCVYLNQAQFHLFFMVFLFIFFFIPKVFITQVPFFFIFLIILDPHNHLKEGNCIRMHFLLVYLNFYCILPHLQLTFLKKYFQHL